MLASFPADADCPSSSFSPLLLLHLCLPAPPPPASPSSSIDDPAWQQATGFKLPFVSLLPACVGGAAKDQSHLPHLLDLTPGSHHALRDKGPPATRPSGHPRSPGRPASHRASSPACCPGPPGSPWGPRGPLGSQGPCPPRSRFCVIPCWLRSPILSGNHHRLLCPRRRVAQLHP